jgi:hypothetical protein
MVLAVVRGINHVFFSHLDWSGAVKGAGALPITDEASGEVMQGVGCEAA